MDDKEVKEEEEDEATVIPFTGFKVAVTPVRMSKYSQLELGNYSVSVHSTTHSNSYKR